jgi:signal transduction histidine kinase
MDSSKYVPIDLEKCDLNALIETAIDERKREIAAQHVTVIKELAGDLPLLALNAQRITAALDCLLRNALDAMSAEGGQLTVRTKLGQLEPSDTQFNPGERSGKRQQAGGTIVSLEIDDTGCGIPSPSLQAVFDPFFTTKATGSGTGLGLTVSRKILELHRASISVSNRPEGGVKVRVVFPT